MQGEGYVFGLEKGHAGEDDGASGWVFRCSERERDELEIGMSALMWQMSQPAPLSMILSALAHAHE